MDKGKMHHFSLPGYDMEELIQSHRGTFIYRGQQEQRDGSYVIKLMLDRFSLPREITRLNNEFSLLEKIDSPYVPRAAELIRFEGGTALVEQDMGRENLGELLAGKGSFDIERGLEFSLELFRAVGEIHSAHIIHKDINPSNIIWNERDGRPALVDFGISSHSSLQRHEFGSADSIEGTLPYISPEQTGRMNRELDYRSDYYSCGVVLYQIFTGKLPFENTDPLALIHAHLALAPLPAESINRDLPLPLCRIIDKLLSKSANDRYQSTYGIRRDLEECLRLVKAKDIPKEMVLGLHDRAARFRHPRRLYGRELPGRRVVESYREIAEGGRKVLLIGGAPGIGKSALVQESHIEITRAGGFYCAGKFDQLQRTIPYSAMMQACSHLVSQTLLGASGQFEIWKERLIEALGHNCQVMVDFLPELKVLGEMEPLQELGPAETQNRFNRVMANFFKVFSRKESPLMIFIDDLQWADLATLRLMDSLLTGSDLEHFLFVGCYRSNEVDSAHPFSQFAASLKEKGVPPENIELDNLHIADIQEMVTELLPSLSCPPRKLAALLRMKTGGNPFFLTQFLRRLNDEGMLAFDESRGGWKIDLDYMKDTMVTVNVVDFMVEQLKKLSPECQRALAVASCLGKTFSTELVATLLEEEVDLAYGRLNEAVEARLILPQTDSLYSSAGGDGAVRTMYRMFQFNHDRIQQAAHLLPGVEPPRIHYRIALMMLDELTDTSEPDFLFDLTDHLNGAGIENIDSELGLKLVVLNLRAAKSAKEATAYDSALTYLERCEALLPASRHREFRLSSYRLCLGMAEVCYLLNRREDSAPWMEEALALASDRMEKAAVHNLAVTYLAMNGNYHASFDRAVETLKMFDIFIDVDHTERAIEETYAELGRLVNDPESVAALYELSDISDGEMRFAMRILAEITSVSFAINAQYFALTNGIAVLWSIKNGLCADAAPSFGCLGLLYNAMLHRPELGYAYGKLGKRLGERYEDLAQRSKSIDWFCNFNVVWNRPLKETIPLNREALALSLDTGDLPFAGFIVNHIVYNDLYMGRNLLELDGDCREQLKFLDRISHYYAYDCVQGAAWMIKHYLGKNGDPMEVPGSKQAFLENCRAPETMFPLSRYLVLLTQCYVMENRAEEGWQTALDSETHLSDMTGTISVANQLFYYLLAGVIYYHHLNGEERKLQWEMLKEKACTLFEWSRRTPENFGHMEALVKAEFARIEEREEDAGHYYDEAISLARENGILHDEALACERAAGFWKERDKGRLTVAYIIEAYQAYRQWGCPRKVGFLENQYPILTSLTGRVVTQGASLSMRSSRLRSKDLDLAQLLKSLRAISEASGLGQLLDRSLRILLEDAGGDRGFLFLVYKDGPCLAALSEAGKERARIFTDKPVPLDQLAEEYALVAQLAGSVSQSGNLVLINKREDFLNYLNVDDVTDELPRSVICIPQYKQNALYSLIYLENRKLEAVFTDERIQMLNALAGQMTISIENALLYENLEERVRLRTKELELMNRELKSLSMRDPLTGCYNRRAFFEMFEKEWNRIERHNFPLSCLMVDADFFKSVNDTHGHGKGDEVLKGIAGVLLKKSRREDCVCRYGGEEFCLLLLHSNLQQSAAVAEKYRSHIEELKPGGVHITVSIGVSSSDGSGDMNDLLTRADEALYAAKERGRNRVIRYDEIG